MGNLESSAKVNVGQLQGLSSRELNISRSLGYEEYQEVRETHEKVLFYYLALCLFIYVSLRHYLSFVLSH